jgi:CRP-like cAMP-binding protein
MREVEFIAALQALVEADVGGLDVGAKAAMLLAAGKRLKAGEAPAGCRVVPFVPGRRPVDEAWHPWLGSSDQAALILDDEPGRRNEAYVLIDVTRGDVQALQLDVSLSFAGLDGKLESAPIPGWDRRALAPMAFSAHDGGLRPVEIAGSARLALAIEPARDLMPGAGWSWEQLDARVRAGATGGEDPYTFGQLFAQQVRVEVRLRDGKCAISAAQASLFACDARRLGSLYERLLERLIGPDVARQTSAAGVADPGPAFHPWYPVLLIGGDKAALYGRALAGDIVDKRRNLTDPGWLLRVGLYLEFLTCLGVMEAVKDDVGDLLSAEERCAFEHGDSFDAIRSRIDPDRWREVWELRAIAFPRAGQPRAGPVSARNLLRKRTATLAFLEAHHDDLKCAIELAGPNHHNAQETWQRVFRDAERAVLRSTPAAFPELGFLPAQVRELVLWHRQGSLGPARVPGPLARVLGDQDGLFASACTQYRESMNAVAAWSKQRALMDYTGSECVPREVSLLETRIARPARLASLQRRDGYEERLDLPVDLPLGEERSFEEVQRLLADLPIFALLTSEELQAITRTARALTLGALERLVVQGQEGTSLFVVVEGAVEVILRGEDGEEWPVDTMGRGALVGEMSLLTGEPRSATVRAITGATVVEIGRHQYEPLLRERPALIDELAAMVEARLRHRARSRSSYDAARERSAIRERIRRFMLDVRGP